MPATSAVPKPLIAVGGRPLLRHVLDVYAAQGHTDFVLAAGYRAELVEAFAAELPGSWQVEVADTGLDTGTAGRVRAVLDRLGDRFFCTYGDGLADVDLAALLARHSSHPGAATVTTVPLRSQYGTVDLDEADRVLRFDEKPVLSEHRINGGFFAFDRRAFTAVAPRGDDLEREVLPALAAASELYAHRHDGFWRSADTYKDTVELSELCEPGPPPWQPHPASGTAWR